MCLYPLTVCVYMYLLYVFICTYCMCLYVLTMCVYIHLLYVFISTYCMCLYVLTVCVYSHSLYIFTLVILKFAVSWSIQKCLLGICSKVIKQM